jgi:Fe-S-cluster-containing hydrogenase component 2
MVVHIVVDPSKCSGCRYCELWCSYAHEKVFSTSLSRIRVVKDDLLGMDFPIVCQRCEEVACVLACPAGALHLDSEGIVRLEKEKCLKCGACSDACPYDAVFQSPVDGSPLICDLCGGDVTCVAKCPTNALSLYPAAEVVVAGAEGLGRRYKLAISEYKKLLERWGIRVRIE